MGRGQARGLWEEPEGSPWCWRECVLNPFSLGPHSLDVLLPVPPADLYCTLEVDSFGYFVSKAKTRVFRDTTEPKWDEVSGGGRCAPQGLLTLSPPTTPILLRGLMSCWLWLAGPALSLTPLPCIPAYLTPDLVLMSRHGVSAQAPAPTSSVIWRPQSPRK